MRYAVALHKNDEGYSVSCPCWSQGDTEQEALENMQSAIEEYLDVAREAVDPAELREVEV
jgi:predicted RNase H-like HicB family nuclease